MAFKLFALTVFVLVGQLLAAPTTQIPERYLGTYESRPEYDQNFQEFAAAFQLPSHVSWTKPNTFYLYKEGDNYVASLIFSPHVPPFELRFKLGETKTTQVTGRNVEYSYTVENGNESPVLKGKFRDTESDKKFTVDALFTENGINATYIRDGVTARRVYSRTICPSYSGYYQNVPERQSANFIAFASKVFPAPRGVTWDSQTGIWLGRYGPDYIIKYIVTPTIQVKFPFRFNQPRTVELNGRNITYTYRITEENFATYTTTVQGELKGESGTVTTTNVLTPEGISVTYKAGDQTATRFYKRVINPLVYGTYESVPESIENWEEFARATKMPENRETKFTISIYQDENGESHYRFPLPNGEPFTFPFVLNKTVEAANKFLPNSPPLKYTSKEKTSYSNDVIITIRTETVGVTFDTEMTFNATGFEAVYRIGSVVARIYYRRVLPAIALGKFESTPDTPEFTEFANSIGSPELLKKTTVELLETPDHKYQQTISVEGEPHVAFPFVLGQQHNATVKGQPIRYWYAFFDVKTPVLTTYWYGTGNLVFTVSAEFTPTGYTATYQTRGKLATRTYKRVGEPVEREPFRTTKTTN